MAANRTKYRERYKMFQRDPGPWSRLLINWLATLAVILVFGLVMLFSASYTTGYLRMGDSFHYVRQQGICMILGLFMMWVFSYIDHRFIRKWIKFGYWAVIALLLVTLRMAPLNGCRRWLRFGGVTLQTSELAKFVLILLTAYLASMAPQMPKTPAPTLGRRIRDVLSIRVGRQLIVPMLPLVPVAVLLYKEPHMSAIILTMAIMGTILMLSGSGGILIWVLAGIGTLALETVLQFADSIPYLADRLAKWRAEDLSDMADQTVQSLYAIGSGGATGLGLGNSVEKQLWLPESTNDFIFSVVCEELGFVGALLIIVLFVLFIAQGLKIAYQAENRYCTMVGIGIMAQIGWQVFCNIAVVTNTIPNTGISLPFFSSGGTSLILLLAEMGIMINIGRNGERAAQQRERARAEREAARKEKTIVLETARAARAGQP